MTGNVAARLADGWAAVDAAQTYVSACESLGYHPPELTRRTGQIREWYRSEEGLDLQALAADSATLNRAAGTAAEVLGMQQDQLAALELGWDGAGGRTAREILRRHGEASAAATAALRTAADVLTTLRAELWQLVDRKVSATETIDGGGRTDWQSAAHTVLTGAGDRSAASELVDGEVKPFVDDVIRCDWVALMHETLASIEASFDSAIAELRGAAGPGFTTGDEPGWNSPAAGMEPPTGSPTWSAPASGWSSPPATEPASAVPIGAAPAPVPAAVEPTPSVPVPPPEAAPLPAASAPATGGALPDLGGGLSTVGRQLVDLLGGLFGPAGAALGIAGAEDVAAGFDDDGGQADRQDDESTEEPAEDGEDEDGEDEDDKNEDDKNEDDKNEDDKNEDDSGDGTQTDDAGETDPANEADELSDGAEAAPAADPSPGEPAAAATPPPSAAPEPPSAAAPEPPPPPATAATVGETPCEIAADELPQVGQ